MPIDNSESAGAHGYDHYSGLEVAPSDDPQVEPCSLPEHVEPSDKPAAHPAASQKRLCGLSRLTWIILAVVSAVVVTGAVVGGAVGGVLRNHSTKNAGSSSTATAPSTSPTTTSKNNVLAGSKLATTKFTSIPPSPASSIDYRAVFFQDPTSALLACFWNSTNKSWFVVNITDAAVFTKGNPINAAPGTFLASTSVGDAPTSESTPGGFTIVLSYVHPDTTVLYLALSLENQKFDPNSWFYLPGSDSGSSINNHIAGTTIFNSSGQYQYAAFAAASDSINLIIPSTQGDYTELVDHNFSPGTGLAMTPWISSGNNASGVLLAYESNGQIIEEYYNANFSINGSTTIFTSTNIPDGAELTFYNNVGNLTALWVLFPNGTLFTLYSNSDLVLVSVEGGPTTTFSAFAATIDGTFYAVSNDSILEYFFVNNTLSYTGVVYPISS